MKFRRPRLTYANVVATIALFIALGGASYAATTLPKGSVGTDQIQAEAVRTGKIAEDAVTAVKLAQGVRERLVPIGGTPTVTPTSVQHAETADRANTAGSAATATKADSATKANTAEHADTATTADSAKTAEEAATAKDSDALGGQPASQYLTANSVLQSGQTEVGDYIAAASNGEAGTALVQFWPHLPETLQEGHIIVLGEGAPGTAECPGPGQAAATYMCIYESYNEEEQMQFESFVSSLPGSNYAGPVSGVMTWRSHRNGALIRGTWAYTAP